MTDNQNSPVSPCSQNCKLSDKQICLECGRSIDEISAWATMPDTQKMKVIERCGNVGKSTIVST
ncbi:MAG: DUF1289 domain-containing protein [Rubritalea sp.]|uniref:DUF1289 domain-containing protein n=1 Tax=Rubritalea sp. TaxID=2109375 RepID=UPI003242C043